MAKKGKILLVDDNKNVLSALRILLSAHFEKVTLLSSPVSLLSTLKEDRPDVVLLDMNFSAGINSGNEGLFWLSEIKKSDSEIAVVLFTAYADIELAVKALKLGASDFVVKPWDNAKLIATLQSALALRLSQKEVKQLREKKGVLAQALTPQEELCISESPKMQALYTMVQKVASTDANILITGENGTGKEVIARMIHQLSLRKEEPLVTVDMGAISETLFESELFGHVKGAFTDARADRAGKFEAADGGTLFLDEIANLGYSMQAKLLVALQSRTITRVGSNHPIPINIRLISATNQNIFEKVSQGEFREDLLYRINTIHLELPPLRERGEDIEGLAQFFLKRWSRKYHKTVDGINPKALQKMKEYAWPGNIRELEHTIEKAVILSEGMMIQPSDLSLRKTEGSLPQPDSTKSLEEMERTMIERAIRFHEGNMSAVATQLGISRPTLYSKIKKYNL